MGYLQPVSSTIDSGKVIFQRMDATAQGGFALDTTGLTVGNTLYAGCAMIIDESTRKAKPTTADTDSPAGLLKDDVVIGVDAPVAVVIEGIVYNRRANNGAGVSAALQAKLPRITFSNSF